MSSIVFPTLAGLSWDVRRNPMFSTNIVRAKSGYEVRSSNMDYPLWSIELGYEVIRDNRTVAANVAPTAPRDELRKLLGFFLARKGSFDNFLFEVPADKTVVDQTFGVGDGSTLAFQLLRTYGTTHAFSEPVHNINVLTNVKKDGVVLATPADYTVNATGMVAFSVAPTLGQILAWNGTYYYRCRFERDESEFNEFMQDLLDNRRVQLVGSLGSKV